MVTEPTPSIEHDFINMALSIDMPLHYLEALEREFAYLQEHYPGFDERLLQALEDNTLVGWSFIGAIQKKTPYSLILPPDTSLDDVIYANNTVNHAIDFHSQYFTPIEIFTLHKGMKNEQDYPYDERQVAYLIERLRNWSITHH